MRESKVCGKKEVCHDKCERHCGEKDQMKTKKKKKPKKEVKRKDGKKYQTASYRTRKLNSKKRINASEHDYNDVV